MSLIKDVYTTHRLSHWWYDADQNHKTGQMGCNAANMSAVDDISLHPSVGPPSYCLVGPLGWIVKECTRKLFHFSWWYGETLWFLLYRKTNFSIHAESCVWSCHLYYQNQGIFKHVLTFKGNVISILSSLSTSPPSYPRIWMETTWLTGQVFVESFPLQ